MGPHSHAAVFDAEFVLRALRRIRKEFSLAVDPSATGISRLTSANRKDPSYNRSSFAGESGTDPSGRERCKLPDMPDARTTVINVIP
jgi:hypothetical protein